MNKRVVFMLLALGVGLGLAGGWLGGRALALPSDESDPLAPAPRAGDLVAHLPGAFVAIELEGNYAYTLGTAFSVIDISNPASPTLVAALNGLPPQSIPLAVQGGFAYFGSSDFLYVIDATDPLSPVITTTLALPSAGGGLYVWSVNDFLVHGDQAFMTRSGMVSQYYCGGNLLIFNLTEPASPTIEENWYTNHVDDISMSGDSLIASSDYICHPNGYTDHILISQAPFLNWLDSYKISGSHVIDVASMGDTALVAQAITDTSGLLVLDISNPASITPTGMVTISDTIITITSFDDRAYLTTFDGIWVIDVSNVAQPVIVHSYPGVYAYDIAVTADYMYTVDGLGLSVYRNIGSSLRGRVLDDYGAPVAGVTVSLSPTLTTTTGADGSYEFIWMVWGVYSVTPTLPGKAFLPPHQAVNVPPSLDGVDFLALPAPVSAVIHPTDAFTLLFTDTQGLTTTLRIPAGAVAVTTTVTVTPTTQTEVQEGLEFTGHAFWLAAQPTAGHLAGNFTFSQPVTVTIHYSDLDLNLIREENGLVLLWWNGSQWQNAAVSCPAGWQVVDPALNRFSASVCQSGLYALYGPTVRVFLPVVFEEDY